MALMRHWYFIEQMKDRTASNTWEDWRKRHAKDPQIPCLGDETHSMVCNLAEKLDMSSPEAMRAGLIKDFRAEPPNGKLNKTNRGVGHALLVKVMKASGLKWFELDGCPYIHWCEKA